MPGVSHICPLTVSIQQQTETLNETGGFDTTYSTILTDVKVTIDEAQGELMVREFGAVTENDYMMISDTSLEEGDLVVWARIDKTRKYIVKRKHSMYMYNKLHHYNYLIRETKL